MMRAALLAPMIAVADVAFVRMRTALPDADQDAFDRQLQSPLLAKINPPSIVEPFNNVYHHAAVIPSSSPLRMSPVRSVCRHDTMQRQADQTWANLSAATEPAGMGAENIVKINAYFVDCDDDPGLAAARVNDLGVACRRPAGSHVTLGN